MSIQAMQIQASRAWKLSSFVTDAHSVVLRTYFFPKMKSFLGRFVIRQLIKLNCEHLVKTNDISIKLMAVRAMETLNYSSKHIGLISSWLNKEEKGRFMDIDGRLLGEETLSQIVSEYLGKVLCLEDNMFKEIDTKARHWMGYLEIREVGSESYQLGLDFFKQELEQIIRKYSSTRYVAKQRSQVYKNIEKIISYNLEHSDPETFMAVMDYLHMNSRWNNFPVEWIVKITNEQIEKANLSPQLKSILM